MVVGGWNCRKWETIGRGVITFGFRLFTVVACGIAESSRASGAVEKAYGSKTALLIREVNIFMKDYR